MKTKRNPLIYVKTLCFLLLSLVILFPVLYSFTNSFMGLEEITEAYSGILGVGADVDFHMFPEHFTLEAYGNVMLDTPEYWLANYGTFPSLDLLLQALGGAVK